MPIQLIPNNWFQIVGIFCCSVLFAADLRADELADNQAQVKKLQAELKSLQTQLSKNQKETSSQRAALQKIESQMGGLQKSLTQLQQNIDNQQQILLKLEQQKVQISQQLASKEEDINEILRLAYKQNNQPLIKLLLLGERPEDLARHLYYFSRLTANQQEQLRDWLQEKQLLADTLSAETQIINDMAAKQSQLESQRSQLQVSKNKRAQVLANLAVETETTEQAISRKEAEREKLSGLIADIEEKLKAASLAKAAAQVSDAQKGQLNWPVDGKLTNRYGRTMDNSRLKWQGWLISANAGQPVTAVAGGRIVFADFFKSHGLLIIVDHGHSMLTLYGRNQTLLQEVGAWVNAGDVIAEVGQSGGYNQSGLYFEVRKNGEPQNPASWLKKR